MERVIIALAFLEKINIFQLFYDSTIQFYKFIISDIPLIHCWIYALIRNATQFLWTRSEIFLPKSWLIFCSFAVLYLFANLFFVHLLFIYKRVFESETTHIVAHELCMLTGICSRSERVIILHCVRVCFVYIYTCCVRWFFKI